MTLRAPSALPPAHRARACDATRGIARSSTRAVNVYLHRGACPCPRGAAVNVVSPLYPNPWRKKAWGPFTAFRVGRYTRFTAPLSASGADGAQPIAGAAAAASGGRAGVGAVADDALSAAALSAAAAAGAAAAAAAASASGGALAAAGGSAVVRAPDVSSSGGSGSSGGSSGGASDGVLEVSSTYSSAVARALPGGHVYGTLLYLLSPAWRGILEGAEYAHFDEWWGPFHYSRGWETMGDVLTRLAESSGEVTMSKVKLPFAEAKSCRDVSCMFCPCGALRMRLHTAAGGGGGGGDGPLLTVNELEVMLLHLAESKYAWQHAGIHLEPYSPSGAH